MHMHTHTHIFYIRLHVRVFWCMREKYIGARVCVRCMCVCVYAGGRAVHVWCARVSLCVCVFVVCTCMSPVEAHAYTHARTHAMRTPHTHNDQMHGNLHTCTRALTHHTTRHTIHTEFASAECQSTTTTTTAAATGTFSTHCNTLQHTATNFNILEHTAIHYHWIPTDIHTCIRMYIRAYMHANIYTCIRANNTYIHIYMHTYIPYI